MEDSRSGLRLNHSGTNKGEKIFGILLLLFFWILIGPLGSFLIDPFLLIIIGIFIVYVMVRILKVFSLHKWIPILSLLTLLIFYVFSISLYLNLEWIGWMWKLLGAKSGFEFMINSWIFNYPYVVHTDAPVYVHLLAIFLFILYPLWLYLGIRLGYILLKVDRKQ